MTATCKTCLYWIAPKEREYDAYHLCNPTDPDTYQPMQRGFEVRACKMPTQTFCETPIERDSFALADASNYFAVIVTAEDFGCVKHVPAT